MFPSTRRPSALIARPSGLVSVAPMKLSTTPTCAPRSRTSLRAQKPPLAEHAAVDPQTVGVERHPLERVGGALGRSQRAVPKVERVGAASQCDPGEIELAADVRALEHDDRDSGLGQIQVAAGFEPACGGAGEMASSEAYLGCLSGGQVDRLVKMAVVRD
jgi:hypothetical protein